MIYGMNLRDVKSVERFVKFVNCIGNSISYLAKDEATMVKDLIIPEFTKLSKATCNIIFGALIFWIGEYLIGGFKFNQVSCSAIINHEKGRIV